MGHWEWEACTITLPSAEFARVRQAVQEADRAYKEQVFDDCQTFWRGLNRKEQTDAPAYEAAVNKYDDETYRVPHQGSAVGHWGRQPVVDQIARRRHRRSVSSRLRRGLRVDYTTDGRAVTGKPTRVLKADMDFPTNKTTDFRFDDGRISLDREKRTVQWETDQNRNAVDNGLFR